MPEIHIHNYCGGSPRSQTPSLKRLHEQMEMMMASMDELRAEVASLTSASASAAALLDGLDARLDELIATGATPDALAALRDDIRSNRTFLAEAVVRNTPADPDAGGDTMEGADTIEPTEDTGTGGEDTEPGGDDTAPGGEDTIAG